MWLRLCNFLVFLSHRAAVAPCPSFKTLTFLTQNYSHNDKVAKMASDWDINNNKVYDDASSVREPSVEDVEAMTGKLFEFAIHLAITHPTSHGEWLKTMSFFNH